MADGGNRFSGIEEVPDRFDDVGIEAQIFRRAAAGDDEGIVIFGPYAVESGVQREVMAAFFGIGLVAFEIMNGGGYRLAGFLAGADSVDRVAAGEQRLER